jgi:hypothetical protein
LSKLPAGLTTLKLGFISDLGHSVLPPVDLPQHPERVTDAVAPETQESDLEWDWDVYDALTEAFRKQYPSVRDVKEVGIEAGLRLPEAERGEEVLEGWFELQEFVNKGEWTLKRRIGWEGSGKQLEWERHLSPWCARFLLLLGRLRAHLSLVITGRKLFYKVIGPVPCHLEPSEFARGRVSVRRSPVLGEPLLGLAVSLSSLHRPEPRVKLSFDLGSPLPNYTLLYVQLKVTADDPGPKRASEPFIDVRRSALTRQEFYSIRVTLLKITEG